MKKESRKIRYAVVGLGHIAQTAVLPAFRNAKNNSVLTAFVTGNPKKAKKLAQKYKVEHVYSYDHYDELLESGLIDAVYICLPNHLHHDFSKRAFKKGVHVLCEKPLSTNAKECIDLIETAKRENKKLMTAYRLHFDPANLKAMELANSGKIGDIRYFNSNFSFIIQDPENIRLKNETGGGPLWDIGVYCLNAARYIFKSEPIEVMAITTSGKDRKFQEVEEIAGVVMKFPENRIANFICSYGAEAVAEFQVFGTKGNLHLKDAYEYTTPRKLTLKTAKNEKTFRFRKMDQFAPEIVYFSDCVLHDRNIEPSGYEGLADVLAISAMYESAATGKVVTVPQYKEIEQKQRPHLRQKYQKPATPKVETVAVRSPSGD